MSDPLVLGPQGAEALDAALAEADPDSLAAATRLRARFGPELAAEALHQAALRRRARSRMGALADSLWWTTDGLEQATRPAVAAWRARRLAAAGVRGVLDLGCGVGVDALAFRAAGLEVIAVERDQRTAAFAAANLDAGARVITGEAEAIAPGLLAGLDQRWAVFCDPARRTARGRSWRLADLSPSWQFVTQLVGQRHYWCLKLGPGLPPELLGPGMQACFVSEAGDLLEAGLWRLGEAALADRAALLVAGEHWLDSSVSAAPLGVAAPGDYVLEPDPAVIRAGLLDRIAPPGQLWLLDEKVAYLSARTPLDTPFATTFEVLDSLDFSVKVLRRWVREAGIGRLEIKKRSVEVDPAQLRRQLRPSGAGSATLLIAHTTGGTRALVVRRVARGQGVPR